MRFGPLALVLALALASPLAAQEQPQPRGDDKKAEEKKEQPGGPGGQFEQYPKMIARFLKDQVDLTEEQSDRVETILRDAFRDAMKRMIGRMGEEQPPAPEEGRKDMEDMREKIVGKIREVLDEGQRKEFEVLVKEFEQRAGQWERERMSDPGRGATFLFDRPLPSKDRTLVKAENVLILNEEEKKAILPLVEKVWTARQKLVTDGGERRRDLEKAVHGGAKPDEIREKIEVARARETADREALEKAENELREVLTLEQEARLVAVAILD